MARRRDVGTQHRKINAPEGCRHGTHRWDGLHTRHLLESTHTNTYKHVRILTINYAMPRCAWRAPHTQTQMLSVSLSLSLQLLGLFRLKFACCMWERQTTAPPLYEINTCPAARTRVWACALDVWSSPPLTPAGRASTACGCGALNRLVVWSPAGVRGID